MSVSKQVAVTGEMKCSDWPGLYYLYILWSLGQESDAVSFRKGNGFVSPDFAAITNNLKYLWLNNKLYFSLMQNLMQIYSRWAAPLAALHKALTQRSRHFPSQECCCPRYIVSKFLWEGEEWAAQGITALSCLGLKMTHQSVLTFIGENLITWPHTDARGLGNTIQLYA